MYTIQQFNAFSPLNKSAGEATEVNAAIRRLVGRTSVLPTDKGKPSSLAKRKRQPMSADITTDTAAGFWGTKSHSSLGRFLHPLDTPFTSVGSSRLSFGAFKGLGYSKVEPLFFYGSKFVFWADQN